MIRFTRRCRKAVAARYWGAATLGWFLSVLLVSVFPVDVALDGGDLLRRLAGFHDWDRGIAAARAVLERAATMGVLGFLLRRWAGSRGWRAPLLKSVAMVLIAASLIELAQWILSARHARLGDLVTAIVAGSVGAFFCHLRARPDWLEFRAPLIGHAVVIVILIWGEWSSSLDNWDCAYRLAVGNEHTGDRPWAGIVDSLMLYTGQLRENRPAKRNSANEVASGPEHGRAHGLIERYRFDPARQRYTASLGNASGGDLLPQPRTKGDAARGSAQSGVDVPRLMVSRTPATVFCQEAVTSGAFAVEARIESRMRHQTGPARIVTLSADTGMRNFTVGQQRDRVVFRVRTISNGLNGSDLTAETRTPIVADRQYHLLATYAAGQAVLYLDGRQAGRPLRFYEQLSLRKGVWIPIWWIAATVLAFIGGLQVLRAFREERQFPWPSLLLGAPTGAFAIAVALWRGHEPSLSILAAAVTAPAIGAVLMGATLSFWAYFARSRSTKSSRS